MRLNNPLRYLSTGAGPWRYLLIILVVNMHNPAHARGRTLAACPSSPNCVSSLAADDKHHIAPLGFDTDPEQAWQALVHSIESLPRTRIVEHSEGYLHAEVTSLVFRFVDDVECLLDAGKNVIHVRSASRTGYGDFGVNRRRVETIRQHFRQALERLKK